MEDWQLEHKTVDPEELSYPREFLPRVEPLGVE
jgi:hypothetical protein